MKRKWLYGILSGIFSFAFFQTAEASLPTGFEGAEHNIAGNQVVLYFTADKIPVNNYIFTTHNGLKLSYGNILSLGDFYERPFEPISAAKTVEEQKQRFLNAFHYLAEDPKSVTEAPKIIEIMENEWKLIQDGINKGEKPEDVYKRIGSDNNRQFNCVTGGGCGSTWWMMPGRYLILASDDVDHFSNNAVTTYKIGHDIALEKAIAAKNQHNPALLEEAYAINAFANHFLSDRYSSGHMRTPRKELADKVTPSVIGSLLVKYMHNEEDIYGLNVHNKQGVRWRAFGDRHFFSKENVFNRLMLQKALQLSVNEIFTAYQTGVKPDQHELENGLPIPDELAGNSQQDISPLFYWDETKQVIMRRVDTTNIYDKHWTADWWGWTTFVLLSEQRGLPTDGQGALVLAGLGEKALAEGIITDKEVANYIKSH